MALFKKHKTEPVPPEDTGAHDTSVGTAADVEAVMKKYDRESNTRVWEGLPKLVIRWLMVAFSAYCIIDTVFLSTRQEVRLPMFVGLILLFGFLTFPAKKGDERVNHMPWYDIVLLIAGPGAYFFYAVNAQNVVQMSARVMQNDLYMIIGLIGILALVELCRRCVGLPILVVLGLLLIYTFYNQLSWDPSFYKALKNIVYKLFYTTSGVIGTPVSVCYTYIVLFIIFGAFLEATGIANFFIEGANAIAGSASGGPAKVAVISSALCGMVSGSSVGNTVTTGAVTIPLMKKTGYPPEFAGAVEAAASTGGQIMPPIMGAAAFLMAEMVGVPYSEIVIRAILPAFLYFAGIFLMVHFKAKKMGLHGLPKDSLPKAKDILPKIYLLVPLIVLVYMIIVGFTMSRSAVYATFAAITMGMVDREKGGKKLLMALPLIPLAVIVILGNKSYEWIPENLDNICMGLWVVLFVLFTVMSKPNREAAPSYVDALAAGTRNTLSVGVACGIAGIIAGVVTMTGLANVLITAIVQVANGQLIIALFLTMLCCIVLGMGVPTTANYVIMATTCAPILVQGMGMDLMAANFFVFYFGIVADITPPVALAAYAGSAIAKAPPMRTAFNATRLAIAAFIVPYIFAFNNTMLFIGDFSPLDVVQVVLTSSVGMFLIAAGMIGYMLRDLNWGVRIVCIAAGLMLIHPGTLTDIIGIGVLVVVLVFQIITGKGSKAVKAA
mgnify:CR=1 FL=1